MISIIIPVYNAEKYLSTCLDSVLAQTFTDWECILVNDGSTDNSGKICEEYVVKDKRFRVVHKENGGVSSARNLGLDKVQGEWIVFLDSDDSIKPIFLSEISSSSSDLVITGFIANNLSTCPLKQIISRSNIAHNINDILHLKEIYVVWAKRFKKELIQRNDIRFDEKLRMSEDTLFCYDYLSVCNNIEFVDSSNYLFTGVFGGDDDKYVLEWEEEEYRLSVLNERIEKLVNVFGSKIDKRVLLYVNYMKLKGLLHHTDIECYELQKRFFPEVDKEIFFKQYFIWDFLFGAFLQRADKKEMWGYLKNIHNFLTVPFSWVKVRRWKLHIIAFLIYYHLFSFKVFSFLTKVKKLIMSSSQP